MKKIIFTGFLITGSLYFILNLLSHSQEIQIESVESKTVDLKPVFNRIKWITTKDKDIWMMNQSHHGSKAPPEKWDRLAIVVDKTKKPYSASFYQIEPGKLEWSDDNLEKRVPYSANCFICHNNGPRGIRANDTREGELSLKDKIILAAWNFRIKTYGRINYNPIHDKEDQRAKVVFRYHGPNENDQLKVKTCLYCHKDTGFLGRGFLVRQQRGTILHLVENGDMPPIGFSLSQKEKNELRDFIRGF